ncbi:MAG: hypothetical protein V3V05_11045 [Pontiella sp.]
MKKTLTVAIATSLMAGSAMAGASGTVDFANAHIFRGATVLDEFSVQPGIELSGFGMPEQYGAFTAGAWSTFAPFFDEGPAEYNNIYETDWYLAYALPQFVEGLDLSLGLTEYQYTFGAGEREINLGAGYDIGGFALGTTFNFMIDDENFATDGQTYIDFSADYAFDLSDGFDVSAGALFSYMMQGQGNDLLLDNGFNHYELYGAVGYDLGEMWSLGFSLAYIGQGDDKVLSDVAYDVGFLGIFGIACEM